MLVVGMRQKVREVRRTRQAHKDSHRREELRLPRLLQEVHALRPSQVSPNPTPANCCTKLQQSLQTPLIHAQLAVISVLAQQMDPTSSNQTIDGLNPPSTHPPQHPFNNISRDNSLDNPFLIQPLTRGWLYTYFFIYFLSTGKGSKCNEIN